MGEDVKLELDTCPRCGSDIVDLVSTIDGQWFVACMDCGNSTANYPLPEIAAKIWNLKAERENANA